MVAIDVPPVPPIGYRVLRIDETGSDPDISTDLKCADNVLENEHYRVEVEAKTGVLSSLRDKKANRELVGKGKYGLLQYVYERVPDTPGRGLFAPRRMELAVVR